MSAELKIKCEDLYLDVDCNPNISCIYKITDTESKRIYIGKAKNLLRRYNDHKSALRLNKHYNPILQRSFNKGRFLKMEVLEKIDIYDEKADDLELKYISFYNSSNKKIGMNIATTKRGRNPFKPIDVYDKEYNFIETCESIVKVVEKFKVNRSSVIMICRDKGYYHFTKNGYHFRYSGEKVVKHEKYKKNARTTV